MTTTVDAVVFDLGGVVLDWDPAHLYRRLIEDEEELAHFLSAVCTREWHVQHDAGRPMAETIPELCERHPDHAHLISLWQERYVDMVAGHVPGTVDLLEELAPRVRLLALTNMPAEVVDDLRDAFPVLEMFEEMVVSGVELVVKPDAAIFELLASRHDLEPSRTLFIDDVEENVAGARACGFHATRFRAAEELREDLVRYGAL